jgi:hypothetical protein
MVYNPHAVIRVYVCIHTHTHTHNRVKEITNWEIRECRVPRKSFRVQFWIHMSQVRKPSSILLPSPCVGFQWTHTATVRLHTNIRPISPTPSTKSIVIKGKQKFTSLYNGVCGPTEFNGCLTKIVFRSGTNTLSNESLSA